MKQQTNSQNLLKKIDISVLILTYNSNINKLFITIDSVLNQKDVNFEIVISDDGSKRFAKEEIIEHFNSKKFENYKITNLRHNEGTVLNSLNGANKCDGKYLKIIAPGDYLYDEYTLSYFVNYMESKNINLCAGKTLYYELHNGKIAFVERTNNLTYEQFNILKTKEELSKSYIIGLNAVPAPSYVFTKELYCTYINKITNKIKYCEDFIFYLLIADGYKPVIIDRAIIYYDCNGGISTSSLSDILLENDRKIIIKILTKNYDFLSEAKNMWRPQLSKKYIYRIKVKYLIKKLLRKK